MEEGFSTNLKRIQESSEEELSLRPTRLDDFIGQTVIKANLKVFVEAAQGQDKPLDHVLLSGPPGLGKTTLAQILGRKMGAGLRSTTGPLLERQGDLAAILTSLEPGQVLFIDEIHRMNRTVEEVLYAAMEDFKLDLLVGRGPMARTVQIDLPPFTLVGATTRSGLLSSPLRERFGIPLRLEYYDAEALQKIAIRAALVHQIEITDDAAFELGKRARGTPRVVNRLLRRIHDYAWIQSMTVITLPVVQESLEQLGIDSHGLDRFDIELLRVLVKQFDGGPAGLNTLTAALSESKDAIEDVYEPFLIKSGYIQKTARGRIATSKAFQLLGVKEQTDLDLPLLQ